MYKSIVLFAVLSLAVSSTVHYAIDADFKITPLTADMMDYYQDLATTVATIKFVNEINTTGWTYQYITTNQNYPDAVQTAAAGYLEGYATWNLIWALYVNYNFSITAEVAEWVEAQNAWIKNQTVTYPDDDFWDLVNTTVAWEEGMYAGYVAAVVANGNLTFELTYQQFYLLSYSSDLSDVQGIFGQQQPIGATSHCSFLLRLTPTELFGSQTTFTNYNQMIRVYKYYKFNLRSYLVHNQEVAFSSYPGTVPSIDDFYVLSNNKYVAETTLVNYNQQAYAWLHTDSVPYWIRIMMANWAFDTMDHWVETYFSNRSGTYNNQWMIVDFNVYNQHKNGNFSNVTDLIWMVEEFYELTSISDLTQTMIAANGYAAGYNVAYNQTLAAFSQAPTNYTDDPRAILFGKYAPGVQTFEEFQYVMRLNNYSDTGDYCQAIASRCDLNPTTVFPWGSIDCKTTSDTLMWDLQTYIQAGPTHELEAPFTWSAWPQYAGLALGMPEVFNFTWVFSDPHSNMTENGEIMISA